MTARATINSDLFHWAIERSGENEHDIYNRFSKLTEWVDGDVKPTLKQLETFAKATHTPLGFFFLETPPEENIPIPDFRTMENRQMMRPSADLLDTLYICQQRQDWYRDFARSSRLEPLSFIGSVTRNTPIVEVANTMREILEFDLDAREVMPTWSEALRQFITNADTAGVMVMCSGIVQNNTRRKLKPEEFRGFALSDPLAPLVFINGADTKSAQMFTLAHELAHLWLGQSALSSAEINGQEEQVIERWCNRVAAELLVPLRVFEASLGQQNFPNLTNELNRLARRFKVSTLVILRRMLDAQYLEYGEYTEAYQNELTRVLELNAAGTGGGNFYASQPYKLSKRFARALVVSTLEGQTLYRDAMRMMGVKKVSTFNEIGRSLGVTN